MKVFGKVTVSFTYHLLTKIKNNRCDLFSSGSTCLKFSVEKEGSRTFPQYVLLVFMLIIVCRICVYGYVVQFLNSRS